MEDCTKLENFLEKQLDRVNSWLTFAEAKNVGLIAFNVAFITFISEFGTDEPFLCTITLIAVLVSSGISLWSFFPQTKSRLPKYINGKPSDNLIFWKDIAYIGNTDKYLEILQKQYFSETGNTTFSKFSVDLATEVVINSQIAVRKYDLFSKALIVEAVSIFLCIIMLIAAQ